MVFNATFNNISVISWTWRSVLLVEETVVPGGNHRPAASHLKHIVINKVHISLWSTIGTTGVKTFGCHSVEKYG